jgi:rubrerythrin
MTPAAAYASSAAFDRDEDAETFAAVALLMAVAHPAGPALDDEDDGRPWTCPECGGDDPKGVYGCACWDPTACPECGGDMSGRYGCGCDW